ncbi:hypothetical protein HYX70_01600 [Candidatus Saccharibacteria bacterium]|nr:hypothetical protein [Candidatus Saccharibacteria bacterium]
MTLKGNRVNRLGHTTLYPRDAELLDGGLLEAEIRVGKSGNDSSIRVKVREGSILAIEGSPDLGVEESRWRVTSITETDEPDGNFEPGSQEGIIIELDRVQP